MPRRRRFQSPTHYAEAAALLRAYQRAVGLCLQYGIPVHRKGHMRALGDLREDIRKFQWEHMRDAHETIVYIGDVAQMHRERYPNCQIDY